MTPLNIALVVAVLVLVGLLWKLRHDRAERDADYDDRPVGSWAAPVAPTAPGVGAPGGVPQAPPAAAAAGSSWVVGGGGLESGGWPAGPVTDPGWPNPGDVSTAWPAIDAPDSVVAGTGRTTGGSLGPEPVTGEPSVSAVSATEESAGLPVWSPPAPAASAAGWSAAPELTTSGIDEEPDHVWPAWEGAAVAEVGPSPSATGRLAEPESESESEPTAPVPPVADQAGESGTWNDETLPSITWSDEAELAVAQQAATAGDAIAEAPARPGTGPLAPLSAYPGPAVNPPDGSEASRGRFALGGHAMRAGQQAVCGVTFRSPVGVPPSAWAVAPAPEAAPGTLVLHLDGAVNCGVDGLQVVMDAGFAPTDEGFTVRVAAREPGPFLASGTFEIAV